MKRLLAYAAFNVGVFAYANRLYWLAQHGRDDAAVVGTAILFVVLACLALMSGKRM